jgi:hypothetical protein
MTGCLGRTLAEPAAVTPHGVAAVGVARSVQCEIVQLLPARRLTGPSKVLFS